MLGGRRASQAAAAASPSAELSVSMWAASDSSASEPDHQPASSLDPGEGQRQQQGDEQRAVVAPGEVWLVGRSAAP